VDRDKAGEGLEAVSGSHTRRMEKPKGERRLRGGHPGFS
jgi:hypothetical protein